MYETAALEIIETATYPYRGHESVMSLLHMMDILDRAHEGPACTLSEWDYKVVPQKATEAVKEYGLRNVCDPQNPVNTNLGLADEFFKAGFHLALETGLFCVDTGRIIKVTEQELRDVIRDAPAEVMVGAGFDRTVIESRKPSDGKRAKFCAPLGIAVSESIWVPLMQGIAQEREVDLFQGGSLVTVFGREVRSGTPYETLAGRLNAQLHREAMWRAGRPGIGTTAVISSVTAFGQFGGFGIPGGFDASTNLAIALAPAELKTNYTTLNKVIHGLACGARILCGGSCFLGGLAGGIENTTVVAVATGLLHLFVHKSSFVGGAVMDARYAGGCGREGIWAHSVRTQALSRAGHLVMNDVIDQTAGPGTEMLLYESAVGMATIASSGISMTVGPRSANGKYTDHLSPLECRFCGEVLHASGGMKLDDVNEIAKKVIPKYEAQLRNAPKGMSFTECYDINTLRPKEDWLSIYRKVKKEMVDYGVPLEPS